MKNTGAKRYFLKIGFLLNMKVRSYIELIKYIVASEKR